MPRDTEKELLAFLGAHHGVAVVHWPRDPDLVEHLERCAIPRLLLVHRRADVPADAGPLQDVMLWPATQEEVHARLVTLSQRAAERRARSGLPTIDARGRVRLGDAYVELAPFEHGLAEALVARFEESVPEDSLRPLSPVLPSLAPGSTGVSPGSAMT